MSLDFAVKWSDNTDQLSRNLANGLRQVDATKDSIDRLVTSLSGEKQLAAADRWQQALQKIGGQAGPLAGIQKLTNDEIERGSGVIDRAIAKYQTLGGTAPKALTDIAAALERVSADRIAAAGDAANVSGQKFSALGHLLDELKVPTDNAAGAFTGLKKTLTEVWESPTSAIQKFSGAAATDLAGLAGTAGVVGAGIAGGLAVAGLAAFELAEKAAGAGGALNDLSEKTGIAVPVLSRWGNAAQVAGGSVETLANYSFELQKRMAESPDTFAKGLERINLDFNSFKALSPDEALITYATALKNTEDPQTRIAAGVETMGKQFRDAAPLLFKLNDALALTRDLNPWTDAEAAQAEAFEMHIANIRVHAEAMALAFGRGVLPAVDSIITNLTAFGQSEFMKIALQAATITGGLVNLLPKPEPRKDVALTKDQPAGLVEGSSFLHTQELLEGFQKQQEAEQLKYVKSWQSTEDEIQKIWGESFVARANLEDGSLKSQLAVLDQRRNNDRNAAAEEVSEKTRSQDQLNNLLAAIDAKYNELKHNALLASNQKELEAVRKIENDKADSGIQALEKLGQTQQKASQTQFTNQSKLYDDLKRANETYYLDIAHDTLSSYDFQREQIKLHLSDQKEALQKLGGNWQEVYERLTDVANHQLDMIAWDELQARIDEADKATEAWINKSVQLFGQLGQAISQVAGVNLTPFLQAFAQTGIGSKLGGLLQATPTAGQTALSAGASTAAGIIANATDEPTTKAGQVAHYAAEGAGIGANPALVAATGGLSIAAGAGIGALVGALKVSPEEIAARSSLEDWVKKFTTDAEKAAGKTATLNDAISAVGHQYELVGKSGTDAQHDLQAAFDASHKSADEEAAAIAKINGILDQSKQRQQDVADAVAAIGPAFSAVVAGTGDAVKGYDALSHAVNDAALAQQKAQAAGDVSGSKKAAQDMENAINKQRIAADGARQGLADLGTQAVTTFAAELAAGKSVPEAFKDIGPALSTIQQSYTDLGLQVDDVGLKNLLMQNTVLTGNPQLIGAIDGLSSEMEALNKLGLDNVDSLQAIERTGSQTYSKLQGQVAAVGGTTKDALIPMQQYLHDAKDEAEKLGVPLDDNTQLLIDQSTELGIWKKTGTDANKAINDSMQALIDKVGQLIDKLSGTGGVTDAISKIPRTVDVSVAGHYTPPDIPGADSPDVPGAATGGLVTARGVRHFAYGGFVPQGTDTVPAMLTPGEIILNAAQQRNVGAQLSGDFSSARESATVYEIAGMRYEFRQVSRYLKSDLRKDLARAVRDEVAKVRVSR